jgi:uncharacterized protein
MECPRCGLHVNDDVPKCAGCGFSIADLDQAIGAVPPREGALTDRANLLDEGARAALRAHVHAVSERIAGEIVVVTLPDTKPVTPRQYAFWLMNKWSVGGPENKGALILIARAERRVECEVGYSFEHIVTDDEAGLVLDEAVVPHLKEGRFADAIRAGVDAFADRIQKGLRESDAPASEVGASA